jgi:hypothetical protein
MCIPILLTTNIKTTKISICSFIYRQRLKVGMATSTRLTGYSLERPIIEYVTFSQPYLSKFNSSTLLIVQYFKFELCSYQFNHFVWLTLLNLQASVLPGGINRSDINYLIGDCLTV